MRTMGKQEKSLKVPVGDGLDPDMEKGIAHDHETVTELGLDVDIYTLCVRSTLRIKDTDDTRQP